MKITGVETTLIGAPLGRAFLAGTYGKAATKDTIITRIHTDEGLVGESFVGDVPGARGRQIVNIIHQHLKKEIVGEDLFSRERIWNKLFAQGSGVLEAVGHLDCAIWDALGKACNQPLYRLLGAGGYREKVPIISLGGYYLPGKETPAAGRAFIEQEILDF